MVYLPNLKKMYTIVLLGVLGICITWCWALSSDAYKEVRHSIVSSSEIKEEFGNVEFIFLYSFRLNYGDVSRGKFRLFLFGEKKSGVVVLDAEKRASQRVIEMENSK